MYNCNLSRRGIFQIEETDKTAEIPTGTWVAVAYMKQFYIGKTAEKENSDKVSITVNCLEKGINNTYRWPSKPDVGVVFPHQIFSTQVPMQLHGKTGYTISVEALSELRRKYAQCKKVLQEFEDNAMVRFILRNSRVTFIDF